MATIEAIITRVDEFEDGKAIKLSTDQVFTTLKEGSEVEVSSFNFRNIELQLELKQFNKLFRRVELFCMGHRCKPQIFKLLLEGAKITIEQVLHKAGEIRSNGTAATFDYYEDKIKSIEFPKLDEESLDDLKVLMANPKLEKPVPTENELLSLLYSK